MLDGADLCLRIYEKASVPMLSRVKPYGSLIPTAQDMLLFLAESGAVRRSVERSSERELLDGIQALAERCCDDASFELHLDRD